MKKKTPKPTLGQLLQQTLDRRDLREASLVKTFTAWRLDCLDVKRIEKRLEKEVHQKMNEIGGSADVRQLASATTDIPPAPPAPVPAQKKRSRKKETTSAVAS